MCKRSDSLALEMALPSTVSFLTSQKGSHIPCNFIHTTRSMFLIYHMKKQYRNSPVSTYSTTQAMIRVLGFHKDAFPFVPLPFLDFRRRHFDISLIWMACRGRAWLVLRQDFDARSVCGLRLRDREGHSWGGKLGWLSFSF